MDPRSFEQKSQEELDDILNSALDELEDEEDFSNAGTESRTAATSESLKSAKDLDAQEKSDVARDMQALLAQMENPDVMASLEATLKQLGQNTDGSEQIKGMAGKEGEGEGTDLDRTVIKTLEALGKASGEMEGQDMGDVEGMGEDIMKHMMAEFEKLGEKEDYNEVLDDMMQQLLSKEMMHDPLKLICERYPEWLATHKESMSVADYNRFGLQYQCMQRVLAVYETEPDNFPRIMELMQDMQEHGQVPAEIVKELAPALEFNSDGLPIMPNMGDSNMPGLPPMHPLMNGMDPQNCTIS